MELGHGKEGEFAEGDPSSSLLSIDGLAMINVKGKLEV